MWALRKRLFDCKFPMKKLRRSFSTALSTENEYTDTPQYPEILDLSYEKVQERKKAAKHEEIKAVKTVEEKQIKLNMDKYYGFKCYLFDEQSAPYNQLNLIQHMTRTHLIIQETLPDFYKKIAIDDLCNEIKEQIEEAILFEYEGIKRKHELNKIDLDKSEIEDLLTTSLTRQVNRIVINRLARKYSHLTELQVDHDPRIEASWFVGGMDPPENIKRCRRGMEWAKPMENEPTDRAIFYTGSPTVTVRIQKPLSSIIPYHEAENPDFHVPYFNYDPRVVTVFNEHKHLTNIPGFWPGDEHKFSLLSLHKRGYLINRLYNDPDDDREALHRQGILSSFGWLHAIANFLGFTTFNDTTYPLVTQTVITNGKFWSFYTYQLNTLLMHSKNTKENPKRNICWGTPEMKLFEEIQNGKVVGFNEDVLKNIVKLYANTPIKDVEINLTPYLGEKEKVAADYENDEKREWLEREYKHLMANRPRHHLQDEIYAWEKIYKIDHKTRPMERRRRFFELFKKPSNRKLNERKPQYIPRKHRPDLPRHKGRDANEYFP